MTGSLLQRYMLHYWTPLWTLSVYFVRMIFHFFFSSKRLRSDKYQKVGYDMFWIGIVIWGGVIVKLHPNCIITQILGIDLLPRIAVVIVLGLASLVVLGLEHIHSRITEQFHAEGPMHFTPPSERLTEAGLFILMQLFGFACVASALYFMTET